MYIVCKFFSHSTGCLFILFMVSFIVQKHFDTVPLVYFSIVSCSLGVISKKIIDKTHVRKLFPMLYFRSFTVWGFTFKSLIHFKIIFVSALRDLVSLFCMWIFDFPWIYVRNEETAFSPRFFLGFLVKC